MMGTIFKKNTWLVVLCAYFLFNIIFAHTFLEELIVDRSTAGARYGEVTAVEWTMEQIYKNVQQVKNPFSTSQKMLVPFGTNFISTDSGGGLFYIFLRPFLSPHQTYSLIVALYFLAGNVGMYLLIRNMGLSTFASFITGLAFGYTTFIMPRMGHLTYTAVFVFPWFYFSILKMYQTHKSLQKIVAAIAAAFFFVITLYLNLYFFIILSLSILLLLLYLLFFERRFLLGFFHSQWKHVLFFGGGVFGFSIPWLQIFLQTYVLEGLPKAEGWAGAIDFSSDLTFFFIPSIYSYFLHGIPNYLEKHFLFARGIFENFTYPGILILVTYAASIVLLVKKSLPESQTRIIKALLFVSCAFLVLTLGPFLHIFGKWALQVDEGIRVVVPLPFAFLHYFPFMKNIRAPGRLIVGFIFFASIVMAYVLEYMLRKIHSKGRKRFVMILLMLVFFFDHYFQVPIAEQRMLPQKIYAFIAQDKEDVSVLELPFVLRDGFTYFGNNLDLDFLDGQLIHNKSVLGGYMGRVPDYKMTYYKRNPLLGYLGRVIDDDLQHNGGLIESERVVGRPPDSTVSKDIADLLDMKYVVLHDDKQYSATVSAFLKKIGYAPIRTDGRISLWMRELTHKEFLSIDMNNALHNQFIGNGLGEPELGYRWGGKRNSVIFKVNTPRKFILTMRAEVFYRPQKAFIYVGTTKKGSLQFKEGLQEYTFPLGTMERGISITSIIFPKAYIPEKIIKGSKDKRQLSAKFYTIALEEDRAK